MRKKNDCASVEISLVCINLLRHVIIHGDVTCSCFQVKAGNSSKVLAQMTLNATTMSVMLNNLTTGATYNVRVVAYTRVGAGPYSQPVCIKLSIAMARDIAHALLISIGV